MAITSDLLRGHTDTIILAYLMQKDSYGYEISRNILETTERAYELKEATLYSAFRRLEENGLISSYWGNETTGARRRYYGITSLGQKYYQKNLLDWEETKIIIDQLIKLRENEDE